MKNIQKALLLGVAICMIFSCGCEKSKESNSNDNPSEESSTNNNESSVNENVNSSLAEGTLGITIEPVSISENDLKNNNYELTVPVYLKGNSYGVSFVNFGVKYDQQLELTNYIVSDFLKEYHYMDSTGYNEELHLLWFVGMVQEDPIKKAVINIEGDGELYQLLFKIPESAKSGDEYTIGIADKDANGNSAFLTLADEKKYELSAITSSIKITK